MSLSKQEWGGGIDVTWLKCRCSSRHIGKRNGGNRADDRGKYFFCWTAAGEQRPRDIKEEFLGAHVVLGEKREEKRRIHG